MKNTINSNQYLLRKILSLLCLLFIFTFFLGCNIDDDNTMSTEDIDYQNTSVNNYLTETPTPEDLSLIMTKTNTPKKTLEKDNDSSYRYLDPILNLSIPILNVTQVPISITATKPLSITNEFLYHDEIVNVRLPDERYVMSYINLDDLNNNESDNSDIIFKRTVGSGGSIYSFRPVNDAIYFYSNQEIMDFSSCLEYFPVKSGPDMDVNDYIFQGQKLITGNVFCVITNEGRMAIIQYIENSIIYNADYTQDLSFLISVYNTILE